MDSHDEKPLKIVLKMNAVESPRRKASKRAIRLVDIDSDDSDTMDDMPLKVCCLKNHSKI